MAGLVENVRQARPELVMPQSFAATLDTRVGSARAAPPKLASYAGKGSLGSWVRIFAMREAACLLAAGAPA